MSDKPIPSSRMGNLFSKKKDPTITTNESRVMRHERETAEPEPMINEAKTRESLLMSHYSRNMSQES